MASNNYPNNRPIFYSSQDPNSGVNPNSREGFSRIFEQYYEVIHGPDI